MNDAGLPDFPSFTSLMPEHQAAIGEFIKDHQPYSDYNFISLWSWDHEQKLKLSVLNDNLVIRFQDYTDPNDFFYSFIGSNQVNETALTLLDHSLQEGQTQLQLIPEAVVEHITDDRLAVTEDRDGFDYIIGVKKSIDLYNSRPKKREISRFMEMYGDQLEISELDVNSSSTVNEILGVFEKWMSTTSGERNFNSSEQAALKKLVTQSNTLKSHNLHVVGLYLGGELSAFCIAEILENGYAMGHFAKTHNKYRHIGAALDNFTAQSLAKHGVEYFNQEQDLGIEGLRHSKMSRQPVFFLKKYNISFK